MTRRKPEKDTPVRYPKHWHDIILYPVDRNGGAYNINNMHTLAKDLTPSQARTLKRRFAAFKACLKANPWHATAQALAKQTICVRIAQPIPGGSSRVMVEKFDVQGAPNELKQWAEKNLK